MSTTYNKVTVNGDTLMDITDTTAVAADVASGKYFYAASGVKTAGTGTSISPSSATPQPLGTAAAGSSTDYSRADHVHAMPTAADVGAEPAVTEVTVSSTGDVTQALDAGKIYHFTGSISSLTLTLNVTTGVPHYHFDFNSGSTAATISLSGVTWPGGSFTPEASKHYEVDILNGYGVVMAW